MLKEEKSKKLYCIFADLVNTVTILFYLKEKGSEAFPREGLLNRFIFKNDL